jgi:ABC-2 type transport system permease protein
MRLALFKVMALSLMRDRGALAMGFILPAVVFVIYAVIFSGAAGGDLTVRLAVGDERKSVMTGRLLDRLADEEGIVILQDSAMTPSGVENFVRSGSADVGLILRDNGTALNDSAGDKAAPILIVTDPSREISVSVLQGALQKAYFATFPDAVLRSTARILSERFMQFDARQIIALERGLDAMADGSDDADPIDLGLESFYERSDIVGDATVPTSITYYAGAVAILFLLFSAANGAMTLLEEKESGVFARLAAGPGGSGVILDGKFGFLVTQGFVQVLVIYVVAWLGFGVNLPGNFFMWALTTLAAAVSTAGIALLFVSLCRTKHQAQVLGNIVILVISALGGSMVPRFLMPPYVQDLGWITPNTWVLEAYASIFWRGEGLQEIAVPLFALAASGVVGLLSARFAVRQMA